MFKSIAFLISLSVALILFSQLSYGAHRSKTITLINHSSSDIYAIYTPENSSQWSIDEKINGYQPCDMQPQGAKSSEITTADGVTKTQWLTTAIPIEMEQAIKIKTKASKCSPSAVDYTNKMYTQSIYEIRSSDTDTTIGYFNIELDLRRGVRWDWTNSLHWSSSVQANIYPLFADQFSIDKNDNGEYVLSESISTHSPYTVQDAIISNIPAIASNTEQSLSSTPIESSVFQANIATGQIALLGDKLSNNIVIKMQRGSCSYQLSLFNMLLTFNNNNQTDAFQFDGEYRENCDDNAVIETLTSVKAQFDPSKDQLTLTDFMNSEGEQPAGLNNAYILFDLTLQGFKQYTWIPFTINTYQLADHTPEEGDQRHNQASLQLQTDFIIPEHTVFKGSWQLTNTRATSPLILIGENCQNTLLLQNFAAFFDMSQTAKYMNITGTITGGCLGEEYSGNIISASVTYDPETDLLRFYDILTDASSQAPTELSLHVSRPEIVTEE
ncbi:hypothetical protein [uncultured Shewanella sp.]|uniref:hypothetical protein n=1 Tax=uncultured Shewanella sp. TaxID=173975 RepID=UPI002611402F|nr:hypothetical protein [uncultured Shewanella sp.]